MKTRRLRKSLGCAAAVLLVWLVPVRGADAQQQDSRQGANESGASEAKASNDDEKATPNPDWKKAFERGNTAYKNQKYDNAEKALVAAVQASPERPRTYLALARTYFQQEKYARSVAYYDFYLKLADQSETERPRKERRLAAHRAGDAVWQLPEAQRQVLETLRQKLTDGTAYTEGGGGAWALYETLLRTGYAHPELARVRDRLRGKLIDEFDRRIRPESNQPTPVLELADWKVQKKRLASAEQLTAKDAEGDAIEARSLVVETGIALVNGRDESAASRAKEAIAANPDLDFLRWFRVVALVESGDYDRARTALETLRERVADSPTRVKRHADYVETLIARRNGDVESAADQYWKWLGE